MTLSRGPKCQPTPIGSKLSRREIDAAEIRRAISQRAVTTRVVEGGIGKRDAESSVQFEPPPRPLVQPRPQDAKPVRFGVPNSIDLKIWKLLDPHTNRVGASHSAVIVLHLLPRNRCGAESEMRTDLQRLKRDSDS
jgi:hypothetical protein